MGEWKGPSGVRLHSRAGEESSETLASSFRLVPTLALPHQFRLSLRLTSPFDLATLAPFPESYAIGCFQKN